MIDYYIQFTDGTNRYLVRIVTWAEAEWGVTEQPLSRVYVYRNGEIYVQSSHDTPLSSFRDLMKNWESKVSMYSLLQALETSAYGDLHNGGEPMEIMGLQEMFRD